MVESPKVVGQGNAPVHLVFDMSEKGRGRQLVVKSLSIDLSDKRLTRIQLANVLLELGILKRLQKSYPNAPIVYPVAHSECK